MVDANLLGYLGVIITILAVGAALAGLVFKLHNVTNSRIDGLANRLVGVEKGQARLEGYRAGILGRSPHSDS